MTQFAFDSNEHEPAKPFELLPAGNYTAVITATDIKENRNQTGEFVKLEYTIVEGEHENRKLWSNHNVRHENPEAERIAKSEMSAIVIACGLTKIDNLEELHGVPIVLGVGIERGKPGFSDQNRVRSWMNPKHSREAAPAAKPAAQASRAPAQAAKPAAGKSAPWAKGKAA